MAVSSPRELYDAMKSLEDSLALALGYDLAHADQDTRITARAALGLVATLVFALVNKPATAGQPLLTISDLQAAVAVAKTNSWPDEPISVPYT